MKPPINYWESNITSHYDWTLFVLACSTILPSLGYNLITTHSGLIYIDIDQQDNVHLPNIVRYKKKISEVPEVAFCSLSASGKSLYVILAIEKPELHREYFRTIEMFFKNHFDIIIDKACKDVTRLRTCSYAPEFYINHNAALLTTILAFEDKCSFKVHNQGYVNTIAHKILKAVMSKKMDITAVPIDWFQICWVLVNIFGEDGRISSRL